jgi:hypothetical protein
MQLHHLPERRGGDEPSGGVQQLSSDWPLQGGGDFNGDGKADVLYRDSSTARPSLVDPMNGTQVTGASSFTSSQVSNPNGKWPPRAISTAMAPPTFSGDTIRHRTPPIH